MLKRNRAVRPSLEALETKSLLSVSGIHAAHVHAASAQSNASLLGSFFGQYIPQTLASGTVQNFRASGRVAGLGKGQVAGSLNVDEFNLPNATLGFLTFFNNQGSVTLDLVNAGPSPSDLPQAGQFIFSISSGTGKFANASGSFLIGIHESTNILPTSLAPEQEGLFYLTVRPAPPQAD